MPRVERRVPRRGRHRLVAGALLTVLLLRAPKTTPSAPSDTPAETGDSVAA